MKAYTYLVRVPITIRRYNNLLSSLQGSNRCGLKTKHKYYIQWSVLFIRRCLQIDQFRITYLKTEMK